MASSSRASSNDIVQNSSHVSNSNQSTTLPVVNASARSSTTDDCFWELTYLAISFVCFVCLIITAYNNNNSSSEQPQYSIRMHGDYQIPMVTKEARVTFYVKSSEEFDKSFPVGTSARAYIEKEIIAKYLANAIKNCDRELKEHALHQDFPTPTCDKLQSFRIFN